MPTLIPVTEFTEDNSNVDNGRWKIDCVYELCVNIFVTVLQIDLFN